jgi:CRISPR-associated protein Cas2
MSEPRHIYLMAYDVTDPKRLRKVHKTMRAWGDPLQYSVFKVRCTARELEELRFALARVLTADDRLLVARLCAGCAERVVVEGKALSPFETDVPPCRIV